MRYEVRVNVKVDGIEGNRKYIKEAESPFFAKQEVNGLMLDALNANEAIGSRFEYTIYYCEPLSGQRYDIYMSEEMFKDIKKMNSGIAFLSSYAQNDLINITSENAYNIKDEFYKQTLKIIGELIKQEKAFRKLVSEQMLEQEIM